MSRKNFVFISLCLLVVFLMALIFSGEDDTYSLKSSIGVTSQLTLITSALETFFEDMNRYPSNEEGLNVLIDPPRESHLWKGPYIDKESKFFNGDITRDVWGGRLTYFYCPNNFYSYRIYSYGKNNRNDFGEKDDITTWKEIDKSYYPEDYLPRDYLLSKMSWVVARVSLLWFILLIIYYLLWGKPSM